MGNICILAKDPGKWMLEAIKNAFNQVRVENIQKDWINYKNVKLIEEFTKNNPSDIEIKEGMKKCDEAILIISEISSSNDNVISETSRAIKAGKPTIVITQTVSKAPALMRRAIEARDKYIITYDNKAEEKGIVLKNKIAECLNKIEIYRESKEWEPLIREINVPIYTLNDKGKIDYINTAALTFFNKEESEVMGKTVIQFMELFEDKLHEDYKETFKKQKERSVAALKKAQEHPEYSQDKDLVFEPLLFSITKEAQTYPRVCHLKVYNGGKKNPSMCIFWSTDKSDGGFMAELQKQALGDLLKLK